MNLQKLMPSPYSDAEWRQEVNRLVQHILSVSQPIAIAVFGSSVEWERNAASDIDLAIIFQTEEEAKKASKRIVASSPQREIPVDWLFFDSAQYVKSCEQGGIGWIIHEKGQFLHGKDPKTP